MSKLTESQEILNALHVPFEQKNHICCYTLLAMAGLTEDSPWSTAANNWIRVHDIIEFVNSHYGTNYAENTRETFRKQAIHNLNLRP